MFHAGVACTFYIEDLYNAIVHFYMMFYTNIFAKSRGIFFIRCKHNLLGDF